MEVERIHGDFDEVRKDGRDVPVGMHEGELAGRVDDVHVVAVERLEDLAPLGGRDEEGVLGAPVVPEIDRVDVICQRAAHLADIVLGDGSQQLPDEAGMVVEIHHEVLDAAKGPGPLLPNYAIFAAPSSSPSGSRSRAEKPRWECLRHPSAKAKRPDRRPTSALISRMVAR